MTTDGVGELDDYGFRPDGAHNNWAVRLVRGSFTKDGYHGGQIVCRVVRTRTEAVNMARMFAAAYKVECNRGGLFIIEPAFYSAEFMPGARRVVFEAYTLANSVV